MPVHNPDCTHGAAHAYSACRDSSNQPLKMLETSEEAKTASEAADSGSEQSGESKADSGLTDADREALKVALSGLGPQDASAEPAVQV